MPSITICNQNLIKASVLEKMFPTVIEDTKTYTLFLHGVYHDDQVTVNEQLKYISLIDAFSQAGHSMEETFVHCSLYYNTLPCADLIKSHLTDAGLCYTFHSKEYIQKHGIVTIYQPGEKVLSNHTLCCIISVLMNFNHIATNVAILYYTKENANI